MSAPGDGATVAVVIFDLDGVVRTWDPTVARTPEGRHGLPPGCIETEAFAAGPLEAATTGKTTDEQWRAGIAASLVARYGRAARQAVEEWSQACGEVNVPVLDLVRQQGQTRRVVLLSNATSRLPADLRALGLDTEFDDVFNSSAIGVAKPDARVYRTVLDALGCQPEASLFIDDTASHVAAASALGIRSHRYHEVDSLAEFLSLAAPTNGPPSDRRGSRHC